jgi:hypothetical protein
MFPFPSTYLEMSYTDRIEANAIHRVSRAMNLPGQMLEPTVSRVAAPEL